jgi:hypothetical protein
MIWQSSPELLMFNNCPSDSDPGLHHSHNQDRNKHIIFEFLRGDEINRVRPLQGSQEKKGIFKRY